MEYVVKNDKLCVTDSWKRKNDSRERRTVHN